jgi:hypothetical protein
LVFSLNTEQSFAVGFCNPEAVSSSCNSSFDCNNNLTTYNQNNPSLCLVNFPGSCYEVVETASQTNTNCYATTINQNAIIMPTGTRLSPYPTLLLSPSPNPVPSVGRYPDQCDPGAPFGHNGRTTSLGCIPIEINGFVTWLLGKFIYIASGISFILLGYGVLMYMTSQGDAKKIQAGSEMITSTLAGLMFVILSVFLLKMIGVDILKIPGFGQ